jgi:hypothetical protein
MDPLPSTPSRLQGKNCEPLRMRRICSSRTASSCRHVSSSYTRDNELMLIYLQIDLLLPSVRPKTSAVATLEQFLLSLHTFLMNIPGVTARPPLDASRRLLKRGIAVPYPHPLPSEDTKWTVAYSTPSDINLVGSWATQTAVKGKDGTKFGVDLAVEMPAVSLSYSLQLRSLTY